MQTILERRHAFGEHDRISIRGSRYRPVEKKNNVHRLQHVVANTLTDTFITLTDSEINALILQQSFDHEEGYFSKALTQLRMRGDQTDLGTLSEAELRTISWKLEWCVRFNNRRASSDPELRPKMTMDGIGAFIEGEKDLMDGWYLSTFNERRKPGRIVTLKDGSKERKAFDYPTASALWNWLKAFDDADCQISAFKPRYRNCGNRKQLDAELATLIDESVVEYKDRRRFLKTDIYEFVGLQLDDFNARRGANAKLTVSERTVRRRIGRISAYERDAARHGDDYALRKYLPVGEGVEIGAPMQRIEMDDWTTDLHTLIIGSKTWRDMPAKDRGEVPRRRCTITVAIDVATSCVVGFNLTAADPSAKTSKPAVRSTMVDKSSWAKESGALSDWPMFGKPGKIFTDGGAAFDNDEYRRAVVTALSGRAIPDQDPRMRGTIESFFRGFKRICRFFAGRSFANVVERGDYKSENLASLTLEEFHKACILYIVDRYHHGKHRGLEYGTPYARWQQLTADGIGLPPSRSNLRIAFGEKRESHLDKHGVLYNGNSYRSDSLYELHKLMGDGPVQLIADPSDVGSVSVIVKELHHRKDLEARHLLVMGSYVEAICPEVEHSLKSIAAITKEQVDEVNKAVREKAKREQEQGKPYRQNAVRKLRETGNKSMAIANTTKDHEWSGEKRQKLEQAAKPKQQAALSKVVHSNVPAPVGQATTGQIIATSKPSSSKADRPAVTPQSRPPIIQPPPAAGQSKPATAPRRTSIYDEGEE